jgi:methyl-accepting chemotaxis protein
VRLGLRSRVVIYLAVAAIAGATAAWFLTMVKVRGNIAGDLQRRATVVGHALDASIEMQLATRLGSSREAQALLQRLQEADNDIVYLLVIDDHKRPVAWAGRASVYDVTHPEVRSALVEEHLADRDGGDASIVRATIQLGRGAGAPKKLSEEERVLLGEAGAEQADGGAQALIGMSPDLQLARSRWLVLTALGFAGVLVLGGLWLMFTRLFARINRLQIYAKNLATGDLTQSLDDQTADEIGDLSRALESITANLGETISRVRVATLELDEMSSQVRHASDQIAGDAGTQAASVRQTSSAMAAMTDSSGAVEGRILDATQNAEASTARLRDISEAIETMATSVQELSGGVEQAQAHLESNQRSLSEVDSAVDLLNEAAQGTAAATSQITASIRSVDAAANEAFQISRTASEKSKSGVEAVEETRQGIDEIRQFTNRSLQSIHFLSEKVASIESILGVINDIANQTRLLSLNASIIAAQAGEHGQGFSVVADEIKALAIKTAGSTREIGGVIQEVLEVSGKVIDAVNKGVSTVDEATARSEHASRVLNEILEASTQAGTLVRNIAAAMSEQSRGAQRVDQAMQDVHQAAVRVREIVSAQKSASEELQQSMHKMRHLMGHASTTAREQASQVQSAIHSMERVFEQFKSISEIIKSQIASRSDVAKAFITLEDLSVRHRDSAKSLSTAVERASSQSSALTESVKVFRV